MQTALPPTPASAMKIGVLAALGAVDRLFDEQSLRRLEFIRRLKTLGAFPGGDPELSGNS